jgi:hypothetical protein
MSGPRIAACWYKRCAALLACGLLLVWLVSCSGSSGSNPEPTHGTNPGTIISGLPAPSALKSADFTPEAAACSGAQYVADASFPLQKAETDGDCCVLSPAWTPASPAPGGLAYACYAFDMEGYSRAQQITFSWDQRGALGDMWIGMADFKHDAWTWRELPSSNQLAFDFSPYIDPGTHSMLVLPVAMGTTPWRLRSIHFGDLASLSGYVRGEDGTTPLCGVEVALAGERTYAARTSETGQWSISGVVPSDYTVTANLIGWQFAPGTRRVKAIRQEQPVAAFKGAPLALHSAGGLAAGAPGDEPLSGAHLEINKSDSPFGGVETWTDRDGNWQLDLPDGSYTVTPTLVGWVFTPPALTFTVNGADTVVPVLHGQKLPGYLLDGYIYESDGVTPLAGVQVNVTSQDQSLILNGSSDDTGYWSVPDVIDGTYTVEPLLTGWTFHPASQQVGISGAAHRMAAITGTELPRCAISGYVFMADGVTPAVGLHVALSGDLGWVTATTNSAGRYVFEVVYAGTYSIVPQSLSYTFEPAERTVTAAADTTVEPFLATAVPVHTVSGHVYAPGGVTGVADVKIKVYAYIPAGTSFTTYTGADGAWELPGIPDGHFVVLPTRQGYTFDPAEQSIDVLGADIAVPAFTGGPLPSYTLSGDIYKKDSLLTVAGVTVLVQGQTYTYETTTGADGHWQLDEVFQDTYTVTPMLAPWKFTPASRDVPVTDASVVVDYFDGEQLPGWAVDGYMYEDGSTTPVPEEYVWFYGDGLSYRCTTDADGHYTALLPNGQWDVQPASTCWSFDPVSQHLTVSSAIQSLAVFYATPGG